MKQLAPSHLRHFLDNPVFKKLAKDQDVLHIVNEVIQGWNEPHRYYHTLEHLNQLLTLIEFCPDIAHEEDKHILSIIALFHDAVYNPINFDNEKQSVILFQSLTNEYAPYSGLISNAIMDTVTHDSHSPISELFCDFDLWMLSHGNLLELIKMENQIFKEYQFADYGTYKRKRLGALHGLVEKAGSPVSLMLLMEHIARHRPKIGVYAGSFDPFHLGHMDILLKAEKIFDKVVLVLASNPDKKSLGIFQRQDALRAILPFHEIHCINGLLTDYLKQAEEDADITLIRGLRNGYDLNYEMNQLRFMEDLYNGTKVVWIPCDRKYDYLSSSALRSLMPFGNSADNYMVRNKK
jgi:pantetheine-phosphate adenylyltransferase